MVFRASEILDLLEAYQGVIRARPLEMGNAEFLQCLLSSSRQLGNALGSAPRPSELSRAEIRALITLLEEETPSNGKRLSGRALRMISEMRRRRGTRYESPAIYVRGDFRPLPKNYSRVTVVFGPALGLGDQITFFAFLKRLAKYCSRASLTIFTLYPNLWPQLLPTCKELSFRSKPLRPFVYLQSVAPVPKRARELVIIADFECFNLHRKVVPHRPGRDILEIALGRRAAWLNQEGSPWMSFGDFFSSNIPNNYWILDTLANQLLPGTGVCWPWRPLEQARRKTRHINEKVIFLNPFTSKDFALTPQAWYRALLRAKALLPKEARVRVLLYPGLHPSTVKYATDICRLSAKGPASMAVRLLAHKNGNPITPVNALSTLARALANVDLCLTVDSFAAHFAPLFDVPTVVVTHRDNREFWVPSGRSFYCMLDHMRRTVPRLVAYVVYALSGAGSSEHFRECVRNMIEITSVAVEKGVAPQTIRDIQNSLALTLRRTSPLFPFREQGMRWLLLWSRIARGLSVEHVNHNALQPYLFQWKECEFFKLLTLSALRNETR